MVVGGYFIPTPYKNQNLNLSNSNMNSELDKNQLRVSIQQQINQRIEDKKEIQADISNLTNIGRILNIRV